MENTPAYDRVVALLNDTNARHYVGGKALSINQIPPKALMTVIRTTIKDEEE